MLLRGTSALNCHLLNLSRIVCGFHGCDYEYYCLVDVTQCILLDMHPEYGAACLSETAVNLIPKSGNIHSSIYVKIEEKGRA